MYTDVIRYAPDAWVLTDYLGMGAAAFSCVMLLIVIVMAWRQM